MIERDPRRLRSIRGRMVFVVGGCFVLLALVMGRAVQLQVVRSEKLGSLARDQYVRELSLSPRRGSILAANGEPLASSADADSVFVDRAAFAKNDDPNAAKRLADALSLERRPLEQKLQGRGFAWVKRQVSSEESRRVRALELEGVGLAPEHRRYYPQEEVAGHLLGFVGVDNHGLEGLERALDGVLRGNGVDIPMIRDVRGRTLIPEPGIPASALVGASVELTLDLNLQLAAEKALAEGVASARAVSGMLVAMDPRTGAVLAMATAPAFDPNHRGSGGARPRNRALADAFEPGSTLKAFVLAAALAEGVVRPGERVEVGQGTLQVGRKKISDTHKPKQTHLSLEEVLAKSSNVAFSRMGLALGAEGLTSWLQRFGFGEKTGIGLGEADGVLHAASRMRELDVATVAFGQGLTTTPLQVAAALSALANDGRLMRPFLVRRIVEADGTVAMERKPELVRQVVPPEVARTVAQLMVSVTEKGGTGTRAAIPGVPVAGKTGTAQKADPVVRGYSPTKRFSSFMGFAPADDPRIAIFVGLDEPKGDVYGGVIAAPVFQRVAAEALLRAGVIAAVPPAGAFEDEAAGATRARMTASAERSRREAETELNDFIEGAGESLVDELAVAPSERAVVPDVRGLPARAVVRALHERRLDVALNGSGRAARQDPRPGTEVLPGTRVVVTLGGG